MWDHFLKVFRKLFLLIWFIDPIPWFDSLLGFIGSIALVVCDVVVDVVDVDVVVDAVVDVAAAVVDVVVDAVVDEIHGG